MLSAEKKKRMAYRHCIAALALAIVSVNPALAGVVNRTPFCTIRRGELSAHLL